MIRPKLWRFQVVLVENRVAFGSSEDSPWGIANASVYHCSVSLDSRLNRTTETHQVNWRPISVTSIRSELMDQVWDPGFEAG